MKALDRHIWVVPTAVFVIVELVIVIIRLWGIADISIADHSPGVRQQVYSSLAGTSSSLLGFTIAAVAIIAAFSPRKRGLSDSNTSEKALARARDRLIIALLAASAFFLVVLLASSVGLVVDVGNVSNPVISSIIVGSGSASVVGLLIGGFGLALAIIERSNG
jgi:hypothetical protein